VNYYINKILKEKTIVSFLEERGIYPQKKTGDKWVYLCPVHSGDSDPSFVVYPVGTRDRDYQTYHCFGCHSGVTLINLKKDLDNITSKESVKFFLKQVEIDDEDVRKSLINDWKKGSLGIEERNDIEQILLLINATCRDHLKSYNDEAEKEFFETFFKEVDKLARDRDYDGLEDAVKVLIDEEGLIKRVNEFHKRQEDKEVSSLSWRI